MLKMLIFGTPGGSSRYLPVRDEPCSTSPSAVDDHVGRAIAVEQLALGQRLAARLVVGPPRVAAGGILRRSPSGAVSGNSGSRRSSWVRRRKMRCGLSTVANRPGVAGHVLRGAEEQVAVLVERVVEQRNQPVLQFGVEIDQEIAAGDQVELGERCVAQQVVRREQADLAQVRGDPVGAVLAQEVAVQPVGRDVARDRRGIAADARDLERVLIDVGGEDLQLRRDLAPCGMCSRSRMAIE